MLFRVMYNDRGKGYLPVPLPLPCGKVSLGSVTREYRVKIWLQAAIRNTVCVRRLVFVEV